MIAFWKFRVEGYPSELVLLQGDLTALQECLPWPAGAVVPQWVKRGELTLDQADSLLRVIEEIDMLAVVNKPMRQRVEGVPELGFVSPSKLIELVKEILVRSMGYEAA